MSRFGEKLFSEIPETQRSGFRDGLRVGSRLDNQTAFGALQNAKSHGGSVVLSYLPGDQSEIEVRQRFRGHEKESEYLSGVVEAFEFLCLLNGEQGSNSGRLQTVD